MIICYISDKMSDKKNKLKRSRISSEESDSSSVSSSVTSSSDEETDAKDLKPIKEYLSNRKELASQLFKSVKAEKIRMMLPQILKKVDFNDLEELCANELIGMSKARIMCIINGQEMLQSSNTEDSDDLGPSLEIISDTEWLSAEETNVKIESTNLKNKDVKKSKKKTQDQKKQDPLPKLKSKQKGKLNVKVKAEVMEKEKQKEGESILDLLELEMRARAIRALIRKEEDSTNSKIAQTNNSKNVVSESGTSSDKIVKARQENLKEQLEKIDVLMKHGEDEDVFVVIQPAPTIELLSSESDTEDHSKRVNQKLVNERISESEKIQEEEQTSKSKDKDANKETDRNSEKNINLDKDKNEAKNNENNKERESRNNSLNVSLGLAESKINDKRKNPNKLLKEADLEDGEIIDDNDNDKTVNEETKVIIESPSKRKIKKIKRNPFIRSRKKNKESSDDNVDYSKVEILDKERLKHKNEKNTNKLEKAVAVELIEIEESPKRKKDAEKIVKSKESESNTNLKIDLFDDKSLDIDEVINLDDYPDDMDDLEKSEINKERKDVNKSTGSINKEADKDKSSNVPARSETWATRYYKQDDVQNVIKESKIQSEIRKRLRERQRQSKMNNSPKVKPNQEILQQSSESIIPKPTGSVEEYLALKGFASEMNSNTNEIAGSSKLLKKNDSFINDNKKGEQSITIIKKAKLVDDVAIVKSADLSLNENVAVEQLSKVAKCDNSFSANSETCLEQKILSSYDETIVMKNNYHWDNRNLIKSMEENSSEKLEKNESNNLRNITHTLRNNETSPNSDSSNDKVFGKTENTILSNKKLIQKSNDQKISDQVEQVILSETKISELRPD